MRGCGDGEGIADGEAHSGGCVEHSVGRAISISHTRVAIDESNPGTSSPLNVLPVRSEGDMIALFVGFRQALQQLLRSANNSTASHQLHRTPGPSGTKRALIHQIDETGR